MTSRWLKPEAYMQAAPKRQKRQRRLNLRSGDDWPLAFLIATCIYLALAG